MPQVPETFTLQLLTEPDDGGLPRWQLHVGAAFICSGPPETLGVIQRVLLAGKLFAATPDSGARLLAELNNVYGQQAVAVLPAGHLENVDVDEHLDVEQLLTELDELDELDEARRRHPGFQG